MTIRDITRAATLVLALVAGLARGAASQDLEPRAYSASPVGTTFVVAAVGRSSGNVLTDPSLPVEDVQATLGIATAGAGYTFDLLSRTALVLAAFPYGRAHATGRVQEAAAEVSRVGWADARFKLSVNLIGGKALRRSEFATARRSTIVGVSLTAVAPTGQYFSDKLVNLGSNRWSLKPEAGVSFPLGHFSIDGYAGVWLFGSNDQFYPGTRTARAGAGHRIPGARELHLPAKAVGRHRRHLVHRRQHDRERRRQGRPAAQLPSRRNGFGAPRRAAIAERILQHRGQHANRGRLQHHDCGLADGLARSLSDHPSRSSRQSASASDGRSYRCCPRPVLLNAPRRPAAR